MLVLESILIGICMLSCYDIFEYCYKNAPYGRMKIDLIAPLDNTVSGEPCPICLEPLDIIRYKRRTYCGHTFCSECLSEWLKNKPICPLCNEVFDL